MNLFFTNLRYQFHPLNMTKNIIKKQRNKEGGGVTP